jgi:polysaccharide chain length determinant protein (PEP-CTERM system associated)
MEQSPAFHPLDYMSMVRRRIWWLVVPVVLALIVGAGLITYLPRQFESTATIGISLPDMGSQVVSDAQRLSPQERLRTFNQVLLSPAVLERVARDEGLEQQMPLDQAVAQVAGGVRPVRPHIDQSNPGGSTEIFYLDYRAGSPDAAQRFANRLAEAFVEESSHKRLVRTEQTSEFIEAKLKQSEARLVQLDAQLRQAKEAYMGALPEQTQSNVAQISQLGSQLEGTMNQLTGERQRLSMIEQRLELYRGVKPAAGRTTTEDDESALVPQDPTVLDLEARLASLRTKYTDDHAEVRYVARELEAARARAAARPQRAAGGRATAAAADDPEFRQLTNQEEEVSQRIAEYQRSAESLRQQLQDLRARVDLAPRVQQQLASLERDHALEQQQYAQLTSRLHQAQLDESVERSQGGEQFTIIARAALPSAPASPNVPRLMIMTMLIGVCLGGALAFGREYLDRSIYDARGLSHLDVPVLGEVPRISQV